MSDRSTATAHRFGLLSHGDDYDTALRQNPDDENRDPLDGYVEAQVHGVICLATDVEALVMDPCYRDTEISDRADRLGLDIEWHEGRVLTVDELEQQVAYRGPEPVRVGHAMARDGLVDALVIGDAARSEH